MSGKVKKKIITTKRRKNNNNKMSLLDKDGSDILVRQGEKASKKRKDYRFLKLSKWETYGNIY